MEELWAPWRMEYILSDKSGECVFCQILAEDDPEKSHILYQTESGFVIMNIYPYNSGHLMVVPHRHVSELEELTEEEHLGLMNLVALSIKVLKQVLHPQGFNLGMNLGREAGAGVQGHLHWHVVPRWAGDTNFMPILGNTKVISQYVADTYQQLKPYFPNQKG
jgi:ATP adenylyltransferase